MWAGTGFPPKGIDMTDQFIIRPMESGDLDQAALLERQCFSSPWSREALAGELENPLALVLAAVDTRNRLMGYVGLHRVLDEGSVTNLAVSPGNRRQGVASRLMNAVLAHCGENGIRFLFLEVRESNAAAIALYEGMGFRRIGRRPRYYIHPVEDALLYCLPLEEAANPDAAADREKDAFRTCIP